MERFSHEHSLIIRNERDGDGVCSCRRCGEPIVSGPFYCCEQCPFFNLHKFCAELPHEWHPQYPLTIDFHPHPLIPLRPAKFVCDACGKKHKGLSYKCTSCPFWVHESCASMPTRIKHSDHHHPLTRAYTLERLGSYIFCGICKEDMKEMDWFYQCVECKYYAHLSCATSQKDTSEDAETKNEDVLNPDVILMPVPDESIHLITSFVERTHREVIKIEKQLNHLGHHHTLTFFDEQIKDELFSGSKGNLCEACVKPILAPFYSCTPCKYFLHKCCAVLPTQIRHPAHPAHPLDLLIKAPKDFGLFLCQCCDNLCNGFSFKCAECQDFYLDVKCSSLSRSIKHIKHEAHKHVLSQTMSKYKHILKWETMSKYNYCCACNSKLELQNPAFNCDICEFNLGPNYVMCSKCAMLPTSLKHRYDKHPFILTYSPIKGHPLEYYCEICEEEIDPRLWFYNCVTCDQSIHLSCICNQNQYSNVKFGAYFKVEGHQHPLTFIQFSNEYGSLCNHCGKRLHKYFSSHPGFECGSCEFKLHLECARDAAKRE